MGPPESIASTSRLGGKIRLRVASKEPLPPVNFLAPFDQNDPDCFGELRFFICNHLVDRSRGPAESDWLLDDVTPANLRLQMDDFEIPFGDPEILRDGDRIEVHANEAAAQAWERLVAMKHNADSEVVEVEEEEDDESVDGSLGRHARDSEEREAIHQAEHVAAILRAGVLGATDDDDEDPTAVPAALDDLPRMPPMMSTASLASSSKATPAKSTPNKASKSSSFLPPPPSGIRGGAAAAMAAFEAKRNQMQRSQQCAGPKTPQRTSASQAGKRKRASSSSSSDASSMESASSESESDSDSGSSSDSDSEMSSPEVSTSGSHSGSESDISDNTDSSSDSAPSEHPTHSDRRREETTTESKTSQISKLEKPNDSPELVPPGQGTNRTKRRNQMRRKKLHLVREAENLENFEAAQERAAQRERGNAIDDADGPAWVEDRKPAYQIRGAADEIASSSTIPANDLPPGGGSFDISVQFTVTKGKSNKRKRFEDATPDTTAPRAAAPKMEDMQPDKPPFGGAVPAGMSIRHIDCQTEYDEELASLEAEAAEAEAQDSLQPSRRKGKGRQAPQSYQKDQEEHTGELDYGRPDEAQSKDAGADQGEPRKRVKLEKFAREPSEPPAAASSDSDDEEEPDSDYSTASFEAPIRPRTVLNAAEEARCWRRGPAQIATLHILEWYLLPLARVEIGYSLIFKKLALDPIKNTPETMRFAAIVVQVEGAGESKKAVVKVKGPLLPDKDLGWDFYETEEVVWTDGDCPPQLWWIY